MENKYESLKEVVTPEIQITIVEKEHLFNGVCRLMDADDELVEIAKHIRDHSGHNDNVDPERIKYLYSVKPIKDGGRYVAGKLKLRDEDEKMVDDNFDYILKVHYKIWTSLDMENKVIQLDKIVCGVSGTEEAAKKNNVDSKEYLDNMRHFGAEKVLNSSEAIDLGVCSIIDKEKDEKKNTKAVNEDKLEEVEIGDEASGRPF